MKGKKLIYWVSRLFQWGWFINLSLAGGIVGFQFLNLIKPQKSLSLAYLGKFRFEIHNTGNLSPTSLDSSQFYFTNASAQPSILVNNFWHPYFVLLFTIAIISITLFYNYQFKIFFTKLYNSIKMGTPFDEKLLIHLRLITWFSMVIFLFGSILSLLKVLLLPAISFNGFMAVPVYDNVIINFFWFSIGMYVLNQIIKVGIELKSEQDLTI